MKILLVSVSSGSGHVRAAQALEQAFHSNAPQVEVRHLDLLPLMKPVLRFCYGPGYTFAMNRAPLMWGFFYWVSNIFCRLPESSRMNFIQAFFVRRFLKEADRFHPDLICATHFLPAQILLAHKITAVPLDVVVTDYRVHAAWHSPNVRRYYVASEQARRDLLKAGARDKDIEITGLPVDSAFSPRTAPPHLDRNRMATVLVMGGGLGHPSLLKTVRMLLTIPTPLRIIAVAGKNEALYNAISRLVAPVGKFLTNLAFTNEIPSILKETDVVVTKAGGLTLSECLSVGVPMVLYPCFPGQEAGNARLLNATGAALMADSPSDVQRKIRSLLSDRSLYDSILSSAAPFSRPNAAPLIVNRLLGKNS